jgi:hypothetical protein
MNGIELFALMKQSATLNELLQTVQGKTKAETQSKRGNLFEKLGSLLFKFGYCPMLPNDLYDHYEGNINKCSLKKVDDLESYLRNMVVFSKGKGGSSDTTLQHKTSGRWVFLSSKFYLDDSKKSIDNYDVEKIMAIVKEHSHKYKDVDIYLMVNDKKKVGDLLASCHSTNHYIRDNIHHLIDLEDLEGYFQELKKTLDTITIDQVNERFCQTKIPLILRFHQELIVYQQMNRIEEGEKELLLGAKWRSGKTYSVGGLLLSYYAKRGCLNALIITPAPTETLSQFTDDLFHKFRDFQGIHVVEIKKGSDFGTMVLQRNNVIIVSKQLLDDYVFEKKITSIQALDLDIIAFDENHFHGTTTMSKAILQSYSSEKTVKVYLTATYSKPLNEWNIPLNCQFYWDMEDEQMCKKRDVDGLVRKHGPDVRRFLNEENKEQLSVYDHMPELHVFTNMMDPDRYETIKTQIKDTSYGFSNSTLFSGNFPNEVDTMLRYITGSHKEQDFPKKDLSFFGRIRRAAIQVGSRTQLNNADFTTQLWFLPFGSHLPIQKVSEHVKERMLKNRTLEKYEIKIVNSKKEYKMKDLKEKIKNWELKAKEDGKDGLILLAGNQLTLGITLPFVDVVFLMNDIISSDKILQMMYRCMTESISNAENDKINRGVKKMGFVVDLNLSRVLNTCMEYQVHAKDLTLEQKMTYLVDYHLINIDSDLFQGKENQSALVERLLQVWKLDPIHHFKLLLKKMEESIVEMETKDQHLMNEYFTRSMGDEKVRIQVQFDEDSADALATGKEVVRVEGDEAAEKEEEEESNDISLTKDVLPFVIPLICILTMNTEDKDMLGMLNVIKQNPYLLEVFQDQSFIWWNKKDIIRLIEVVVGKYIHKDSAIYTLSLQIKMSLQSLIDRPKELLELIDSCLQPKQKEKQENGEVPTPMAVVFDKLDHLDKAYLLEHGRSIFSEKEFKWFDPASGMGNFPVAVYLRLFDGLDIPDEELRKKHILENMLYMSELNKKNVFICHQIFNANGKYKLNLYEGDTLELDVRREWSIDQFDVILGNPPYNKGGIRSHTGKQLGDRNETIWTKFVEYSFQWLKPDGFLVFITPLSWLKSSHSLHRVLLEKHIVWLKLWDDSQSKGMIHADIPISLYVLQNTPNTEHKKTEITSEIRRKKRVTTSSEYLNPAYSIPLAFHSVFDKLIRFIETRQCKLEYKTKTVKSSGTKEKLTAHTSDGWAIDTYTLNEGILVKKAIETHPDANKRKLIIANKRGFKGAFIDEGKLSLTGNHKFYILGDHLELVKKMLDFKIGAVISDYPKYGQSFLDNDAFQYLPDLRKLGITDITEEAFYTLIGLTEEEILQLHE